MILFWIVITLFLVCVLALIAGCVQEGRRSKQMRRENKHWRDLKERERKDFPTNNKLW